MRLDIDILAAEQLFCTLPGDIFRNVYKLTTSIVPLAGISFGVLVGHYRPASLHNGSACKIFRRNQLEGFSLTANLAAYRVINFLILLLKDIHVHVTLLPLSVWLVKNGRSARRLVG